MNGFLILVEIENMIFFIRLQVSIIKYLLSF